MTTESNVAADAGAKPLSGLKVLDFCWVAVGPMITKYLAEYGATVIRVESSKRPDTLRSGAPLKDDIPGINRSGYFANYNANKYGVAIDMRHPKARPLILKLATWADLLTENFTPGTLESWEMGFNDLKKLNPKLVMFSTSMLGRGGPMEKQPGFGAVLSSLAGLTYITGWPDRDPVNPYGAYTDFIGPKFAVASILAGLDYARRTGEGMHLDMSQLEASLHFTAPFMLDQAVNGHEQARMGNRDPDAAPHGVYPCQGEERWIAIACFTDQEWQTLAGVIGESGGESGQEWAKQDRFAGFQGRKENEDELDELLGQWTAGWDSRELMGFLQERGVAAGVINDCSDLFTDPQLTHQGHYVYLDHPELGVYATERSEVTLSLTPGRLNRPSPLLGQDTHEALTEVVGLTEEEYQALEAEGVFI